MIALLAILFLLLTNIEERVLFFIFVVVGLLQSYLNLLYLVSRAENRYAVEALSQAIQCVLFVAGAFLIATLPNPVEIALVLLIPRVILIIVTIPYFRRFSLLILPSQERFVDSIRSMQKSFLRVSSMGMFSVLALSNMYIDNFVLGIYVSSTELGLFQAHVRMMLAFITVFEVVGIIIQNDLIRFYENKEIFKRTATLYLSVLAGSILVILWPLSIWYGEIAGLLLGENFDALSQYFPYLAVILYLRVLGTIYGIPITFEAGWQRVAILLVTVVMAVSLNFALVPKYGIEGALMVSVITHIFLNLSYLFFSYGYLRKKYGALLIAVILIWVISFLC